MAASHKWIKLKRDCAFGKKGQTVQVASSFADERVKLGHADIVREPAKNQKRREAIKQATEEQAAKEAARVNRPEVSNKAMSAK